MSTIVLFIIFVSVTSGNDLLDVQGLKSYRIMLGDEFCLMEFFNPKCSIGQLLLIESAKYGRMNIGKCIKEQDLENSFQGDKKIFGCHSDVTSILHDKCSFHQECNVEVRDDQFNRTTNCYSWTKSHLSVAYRCLNVLQTEVTDCHVLVSDKVTHLIIDNTPRCGDPNNPWLVETHKGQTIRIAQMSFSPTETHLPLICSGIGITIVDEHLKSNMTICQEGSFINRNGGILQENKVFKSKNGFVKIFRHSPYEDQKNGNIKLLLKIEADGCTDIIPPEDTWLKRTNDDIVVGCYSSKQTWYLRCENGRWTGTMGNCSHIVSKVNVVYNENEQKQSEVIVMSEENQILIIFAISAFGVVICLLIICCGFLLIKRYKEAFKFNPSILESYYRKEGQQPYNQQSHPYSYATVNNTMSNEKRNVENNQETSEDKYFILENSAQNK